MSASLPILYSFRRCPYAMRARLALAASSVACELREVVLRSKPQALLEASPKGTVPVLITPHGQVLDQSLDIMRWALQQHDPGNWLTPELGSPQAMHALIAECDGSFKRQLDRYKYPGRFESEPPDETIDGSQGTAAQFHRTEGARFLAQLNAQLATASHLFGERAAWADMAIAPFVRQFSQTDQAWFDKQPWPGLQRWLASVLYGCTIGKYQPWVPGAAAVRFS